MTGVTIDPDLIRCACRAGDRAAIVELSDCLIGQVEHKPTEAAPVRAHGALPESVIKNYAYRMLQRCGEHDFGPPRELLFLLQKLLKQDAAPRTGINITKRARAVAYVAQHPKAEPSEVAENAGINRKTARIWMQEDWFKAEVAKVGNK